MSGKEKKGNGVQVFIHKNSPGNELQQEMDKGRRKMSEECVMEEDGDGLEPGVAGHLLLSPKSLIKAQEHISSITVSFPVTSSLDQERISSQSIKIGSSSSPE